MQRSNPKYFIAKRKKMFRTLTFQVYRTFTLLKERELTAKLSNRFQEHKTSHRFKDNMGQWGILDLNKYVTSCLWKRRLQDVDLKGSKALLVL